MKKGSRSVLFIIARYAVLVAVVVLVLIAVDISLGKQDKIVYSPPKPLVVVQQPQTGRVSKRVSFLFYDQMKNPSLDGDLEIMDRAINTMIGKLTDIICDGAKMTCSLKIYSCVEAANLACKLAFRGYSPGNESGIVGKSSFESMDFLSRISSEGMEETDKTILSIMLGKQT